MKQKSIKNFPARNDMINKEKLYDIVTEASLLLSNNIISDKKNVEIHHCVKAFKIIWAFHKFGSNPQCTPS